MPIAPIDEGAIRAEAQAQAKAITRRAAAYPAHRGMALPVTIEVGHS